MPGALERIDHWLFFFINSGWASPLLDPVFLGLSHLGGWTIGIVALAALASDNPRAVLRHVMVLAVFLAIGAICNAGLKHAFGRPRPVKVFKEQIAQGAVQVNVREVEPLKKNSFPSGHSMLAFFLMVYVGQIRRSIRPFALLLACGIAVSRVYVGSHFPFDCLVGALLGAGWGLGAWLVHARLQRAVWNTP